MAKDIVPPQFPKDLSWDDDNAARASLKSLYEYADAATADAIDWYFRHKRRTGLVARGLRVAAIILTAIGGISPLLVNARVWVDRAGATTQPATQPAPAGIDY